MWDLIRLQLLYNRKILTFGALVVVLLTWPQALWLSKPEALRGLVISTLLVVGLPLNMILWTVELREQRLSQAMILPISPRSIGRARLLSPVLVQLTAGLLVLPAPWLAQVFQGHDPVPMLEVIVSAQGFMLLTMALILFQEEISLWSAPWPWVVVIANLTGIGLFLIVAFGQQDLFDTWQGALVTHLAALLVGGVSYWAFLRRRDYLLRISPLSGFPEGWEIRQLGRRS